MSTDLKVVYAGEFDTYLSELGYTTLTPATPAQESVAWRDFLIVKSLTIQLAGKGTDWMSENCSNCIFMKMHDDGGHFGYCHHDSDIDQVSWLDYKNDIQSRPMRWQKACRDWEPTP